MERRRQPPPTPRDYLQQLPAIVLLNRLPTPTLAVGLDGELIYVNPAFAAMLGYPDANTLTGQPLSRLMAGLAHLPGHDCVTALRAAAGTVAEWCHVDGYHVRTVVSKALLTRVTDPLLLVTLIDVTDVLWSSKS
ncbi:PAS domain-containing protein [Mycobacterium malmoense]|uniref:PAS domain-containing protein n=1 Tax=Mycobacterium malmoense TaxID=1780 RepID=A0ABX3SNM0_MYCMA|nr:hypothetical protein BMG05_08015 [Mycobacterium malmoense]ORA79142.1 hypothetical protein BST29_19960 [Mycobacterium malmoense]QZA20023.1 PAS domain-containing protein [Mycobacterium malmoense]UNB96777.1 PAS domain-containing protein [Mycobacterium malmoense]